MSNTVNADSDQPTIYHIRIKGHLGPQWTDWFGGLSISLEANGETLLTGRVVDQAALHGLLRQVRDLGMELLSVNRVALGHADTSDGKQAIDGSPPIREAEAGDLLPAHYAQKHTGTTP